jgi:2-oxoglutarate ferredoxin oxidoreductase subunit gamma
MTHELLLGGFGGQGVKIIASLLAQAAHDDGRYAMMYNIYAAAIRGGPIFCTVLVSDRPIPGAPMTTSPTAVLAMDPNTVHVYEGVIRPGGTLVVNSSLVRQPPTRTDLNVVLVPTNEIAEQIGDIRYTGMVGLGALIGGTAVVSFEAVRRCLEKTLPSYRHHMIPANLEALTRGAACVSVPAPQPA